MPTITRSTKSKPAAASKPSADPKLAALRAFCADMNKKMNGAGRIDVGADIKYLDPPRLRTGILGLDCITGGGMPRGMAVQFWGPDKAGKSSTAVDVMAAAQREGSHVCFVPSEGFDKEWYRLRGLWIPYGKDEIAKVHAAYAEDPVQLRATLAAIDAYNKPKAGRGELTVIQHPMGDGALEGAAQAVMSNIFAVVCVDSIAVMRNTRQLEDQEVGQEEMGGGGQIQMHNRFLDRVFAGFNTRYDDEGNKDLRGDHGNQTCLLVVNQARDDQQAARMPGRGMMKPPVKPTGGRKMRHAWHLSIEFSQGERAGERVGIDGSSIWRTFATDVQAKVDKSKICTPYRETWWKLYCADHEDHKKGSIDVVEQARVWGVHYKVIKAEGAWYTLPNGQRVNGKERLESALRDDPDLREHIEDAVIAAARLE